MTVTPAAAGSATNHNEPDRADLAQQDPSYSPATRGCATCYGTARRRDTPARTASTCPARTTGTQGVEASLSSPRCRTQIRPQRPLPTTPGQGPHFPDPSDPPATRKGGSATPGAAIPPDPPLPRHGSARGRAKGSAKHAEPAAESMTTGVLSNSARRQIRALALGNSRQPAVRTGAETRAARPALVHANFSNLHGAPVRSMGRPPRTLSRAWPQVLPRRPSGTQPRNTTQQHLTVRQTDRTDVNLPDICNRCPESGGQPSQPVVSSTHGNPTTSSYNPPGEGHASRTP